MARKAFAWSPVRELMKKSGAEMVSKDAVDALIDILVAKSKELTNRALVYTRHADRVKLTKEDMDLAIKYSRK